MGWTTEQVETLERLHKQGLSCTQIADRLGDGKTRNAVIGKLHRLLPNGANPPRSYTDDEIKLLSSPTLSDREIAIKLGRSRSSIREKRDRLGIEKPKIVRHPPKIKPRRLPAALWNIKHRGQPTPPQPVESKPEPIPATAIRLIDHKHGCRFVIGEPCGADTLYCGAEEAPWGGSYCPHHAVICRVGA